MIGAPVQLYERLHGIEYGDQLNNCLEGSLPQNS